MKLATLLLALFTVPLFAETPLQLTPREREAFEYLRTATHFEHEGVGEFGTPSQGYVAFRIVARAHDASRAFEELLEHGTPAAAIYALIGIRHLDPKRYDEIKTPFAHDDREIGDQSGCILWNVPLFSLVRAIDEGLYASAFEDDAPKPTQ